MAHTAFGAGVPFRPEFLFIEVIRIVDPEARTVTQYAYRTGQFVEMAILRPGDLLVCPLFPSITYAMADIFAELPSYGPVAQGPGGSIQEAHSVYSLSTLRISSSAASRGGKSPVMTCQRISKSMLS